MNRRLKLSAEQVIIAIQQLSPAEKRKVQRHLPTLFGIPEHATRLDTDQETTVRTPQKYAFNKVRKLLNNIQGPLSQEVIWQREDRI